MSEGERRVALICGATGPVGTGCARALAAQGLRVAVHYRRDETAADDLVRAIPGAVTFRADLEDPAQVDEMMSGVARSLGTVDVLVNAAHQHLATPLPVAETSTGALDTQLAGVRMHLTVLRRVLPAMRARQYGRIIYISGGLADRPAAGFAAYGAAKSAAAVLTRYVALEEGEHGITANIVAPGPIAGDSGLTVPHDGYYQDLAADLGGRLALGRWPTADDVAGVVAFLASPAAGQLTGHTIPVNGGEPG